MSKKRLAVCFWIISLPILLSTCRDFNNPVDSESENYSGIESVDLDKDGFGSYVDVDDIYPVHPEDGAIISELPVTLETNKVDSTLIKRFKVQLATDPDFTTYKEFTFPSHIFPVAPVNPQKGQAYYWRAKSYDTIKWSSQWSAKRSFRITLSEDD